MQLRRAAVLDNWFFATTRFLAAGSLLLVAAIFIALFISSWPALREFGFGFFISSDWDPVFLKFGAFGAILGTLVTSLIALILAVPLALGIALFITEMAPGWLKRPIALVIELMAGIPSIIYGMWGLFVLAPLISEWVQPVIQNSVGRISGLSHVFSGPPLGIGLFTAGVILAIMIIPLMASVLQDLLRTVPALLKEAAYGHGATRFEVIKTVMLPYIRTGILGSVILGFGRALGETMAVTFVIGNAHGLITQLFAPGASIASVIANEFAEATGTLYPSSLLALGLILFIITFIVLVCARALLNRYKHP